MGFTLGKFEVLHKSVRQASTKEDKAPKNPYDVYVSIRNKPGTGVGPDGVDTGKKAVVVRNFSFQKPFITREQLDNSFKTDAVKGTIIDGDKFDETFALSVITDEAGDLYFVKVREDYPEIHAFFAKENPNEQAKSSKATLTAVAEHLAAKGLIKNEVGEQKYFNLVPMKNDDDTDYSTDIFLKVFAFEPVDIDAPATPETLAAIAAAKAAKGTTEEPAPAGDDDDEPVIEDVPEDEIEDEDDDVIE